MTDDIVTRLRDCTCVPHGEICRESADEIERLREERNEAEPLLNELWERRTEATEMRSEIERLRSERDEVIIHANNVVRESSSLITAKIPCGSCGGYWNAVDNFRRFESKTT